MGSHRERQPASDEQRTEYEIVAAEEVLERLTHLPPSPKTNLSIVLIHRVLDALRAHAEARERHG